ncbi:hypothetical protein SBV1_60018 [Verrucomicrobia bacterium]|nr:hypothetical protein SBV1_60018 [Verrucomicrobiota bacterium]
MKSAEFRPKAMSHGVISVAGPAAVSGDETSPPLGGADAARSAHADLAQMSCLPILFTLLLLTLPMLGAERATYEGLQPDEFLKTWLVLKSIPVPRPRSGEPDELAQKQAFVEDWLATQGGEAKVQPRVGLRQRLAGESLKWQLLESKNDVIDLRAGSEPGEFAIAYAWAEINLAEPLEGSLGVGSDDAVRVWLNGKLIHENWANRRVRVDDDVVPVHLERGTNQLLLKIQNGRGLWGFACRLMGDEARMRKRLAAAPTAELTDGEIKTVLRDAIEGDKLGVGLVVGMIDAQGSRLVSYGKRDDLAGQPVDGNTVFELGTLTKLFTGLLLADMVERGQMKLDDPVQQYLPPSVRMPTHRGKAITLLHLATDTSGLPQDPENLTPRSWRNPYADYTVEKLYAFLSHHKLPRDPGAEKEESNVGKALLAHVIALRAGTNYETLLRDRICRPLGMNDTCLTLTPELKARQATSYALADKPVPNCDFSAVLVGAGGLHSTANDLSKFLSAALGVTPCSLTPTLKKLPESHRLESGLEATLGWDESSPTVQAEGETFGCRAFMGLDPDRRRGLVVLANCYNESVVENLKLLLKNQSAKPSQTASVDVKVVADYVGQYRSPEGQALTVRREGDRLMLQWLGRPGQEVRVPSVEVFPESAFFFYNQLHNVSATFRPDGQGKAERIRLIDREGAVWEGSRVSEQLPQPPMIVKNDPALLDRYIGQYRFTWGLFHVGPVVSFNREQDELGDHLVGQVAGYGGAELFPESATTFFTPLVDCWVTFGKNQAGKVTHLVGSGHGVELRLVKTSDSPLK